MQVLGNDGEKGFDDFSLPRVGPTRTISGLVLK